MPNLKDLEEISEKFFKDYCENYSKIRCLFDCYQAKIKDERYKKLSDLLEIYKVPLVYQKSPNTLIRELSKDKSKSKKKEEKKS